MSLSILVLFLIWVGLVDFYVDLIIEYEYQDETGYHSGTPEIKK